MCGNCIYIQYIVHKLYRLSLDTLQYIDHNHIISAAKNIIKGIIYFLLDTTFKTVIENLMIDIIVQLDRFLYVFFLNQGSLKCTKMLEVHESF